MKPLWTPPPPPKCPRVVHQSLPRRPRRARVKSVVGGFQHGHVCPPMDLLHPSIMLSLLAEAPRQVHPLQADKKGVTAPRIPCVYPPPAPLGPVELPPPNAFGSTPSIIAPVGRNGDQDGGPPRTIRKMTAAVVPPCLLSPACAKRIAQAAWIHVDPVSVPELPGQIIVPAVSQPWSSTQLVDGATKGFPRGDEFSAFSSAIGDIPGTCERSDALSVKKPVSVDIPPPFFATISETESSIEWTGVPNILAIFGNPPLPGFTSRLQEVVDDIPRSNSRLPAPSTTSPCVPAVPDLTPMFLLGSGETGAAVEYPGIVPVLDGPDVAPLEELGGGLPGVCDTQATHQKSISQESAEHSRKRSQLQPRRDSKKAHSFDETPIWRDGPSDKDGSPDAPRPAPEPIWRDSDELSEELGAFCVRSPCKKSKTTGKCDKPLHDTTLKARPRPGEVALTRSRSPSPLSALFRRKGTPKIVKPSGGKRSSKPYGRERGHANKKNIPGRNARRVSEAVWKDSVAVPRKPLIDPTRISELMLGFEAAPRPACIKSGAPMSRDESRIRMPSPPVVGDVNPTSTLPPPPQKTNWRWRYATHPLRVRRHHGQELNGHSPMIEDALMPVAAVVERSGGPARKQSRTNSREKYIGSTTSSTTAASFWKSITSIPDEPPAPHAGDSARGHPQLPANSRVGRRWLRAPDKHRGTVENGSPAVSAPRRAPAFELKAAATGTRR